VGLRSRDRFAASTCHGGRQARSRHHELMAAGRRRSGDVKITGTAAADRPARMPAPTIVKRLKHIGYKKSTRARRGRVAARRALGVSHGRRPRARSSSWRVHRAAWATTPSHWTSWKPASSSHRRPVFGVPCAAPPRRLRARRVRRGGLNHPRPPVHITSTRDRKISP